MGQETETKITKEPFRMKWHKPTLDWFEIVDIEIKPEDYLYFRIERRYGPSWWLVGMNPKEKPKYHWEHTQIAELLDWELRQFIEWAKTDKGSRIIEIKSISGDFDIIGEITKVLNK